MTAREQEAMKIMRAVMRQEVRQIGDEQSIWVDVLECGHAVRAIVKNMNPYKGDIDLSPQPSKMRNCASCKILGVPE